VRELRIGKTRPLLTARVRHPGLKIEDQDKH
jgi:hypothetical protein